MELIFSFGVAIFIGILFVFFIFARDNSIGRELKGKLEGLDNFTPSICEMLPSSKQAIALDIERRKIALVNTTFSSPYSIVIPFDDLIAAEVVRDDTSIHKTNRGGQMAGAAVGGILLGPAGLIVGGLSGSRREEHKIRKIALRIYTRDLVRPVHEVVFFNGGSAGMDVSLAEYSIRFADEWYGRMRSILDGRGSQ